MTDKILVLAGDGIGQEVTAQAVRVLDHLKGEGVAIEYELALIGGAAIDDCGNPLPESTIALAKASDGVLLGAVGGAKWDALPHHQRPERGLIDIRKHLGLFANLRPAKSYPALEGHSSLRPEVLRGTDMLIVRELIGGLYYGEPRGEGVDENGMRYGVNTTRYTEAEVRRVAIVAFEAAKQRRGKVTSTDKANVLEVSRHWRTIVDEVSADYPSVTLEHLYADNAAMQFVRMPQQFDVVLAPNVFGDMLSDLAAAVVGSIGLLPSASLNQDAMGLFEPVHGSAPDIAGRGIANPMATLLSLAMLFRTSLKQEAIAARIEKAVGTCIADGTLTADLIDHQATNKPAASTAQVGDAVLAALGG